MPFDAGVPSSGLFFEDYEVGTTYKHWPGRTITQQDNIDFSIRMFSYNPIYLDEEYAKHTPFGRCVINPLLVANVSIGMSVKDMSQNVLAALGFDSHEFFTSVFPGDTIYSETRVLEKRDSRSRPFAGVVTLLHIAHNQRKEKIFESKRSIMVHKKSAFPVIERPSSKD
jgi:itaconyl-CoA hydratase